MGLFSKKKPQVHLADLKCPVEGCSFTCDDSNSLQKHVEWKHPKAEKAIDTKPKN